eukprot:m.254902 g.254902  ORF g.254902 m.254902 type:complete len:966 (-) comp15496_c0_seq6:2498-5395(-)
MAKRGNGVQPSSLVFCSKSWTLLLDPYNAALPTPLPPKHREGPGLLAQAHFLWHTSLHDEKAQSLAGFGRPHSGTELTEVSHSLSTMFPFAQDSSKGTWLLALCDRWETHLQQSEGPPRLQTQAQQRALPVCQQDSWLPDIPISTICDNTHFILPPLLRQSQPMPFQCVAAKACQTLTVDKDNTWMHDDSTNEFTIMLELAALNHQPHQPQKVEYLSPFQEEVCTPNPQMFLTWFEVDFLPVELAADCADVDDHVKVFAPLASLLARKLERHAAFGPVNPYHARLDVPCLSMPNVTRSSSFFSSQHSRLLQCCQPKVDVINGVLDTQCLRTAGMAELERFESTRQLSSIVRRRMIPMPSRLVVASATVSQAQQRFSRHAFQYTKTQPFFQHGSMDDILLDWCVVRNARYKADLLGLLPWLQDKAVLEVDEPLCQDQTEEPGCRAALQFMEYSFDAPDRLSPAQSPTTEVEQEEAAELEKLGASMSTFDSFMLLHEPNHSGTPYQRTSPDRTDCVFADEPPLQQFSACKGPTTHTRSYQNTAMQPESHPALSCMDCLEDSNVQSVNAASSTLQSSNEIEPAEPTILSLLASNRMVQNVELLHSLEIQFDTTIFGLERGDLQVDFIVDEATGVLVLYHSDVGATQAYKAELVGEIVGILEAFRHLYLVFVNNSPSDSMEFVYACSKYLHATFGEALSSSRIHQDHTSLRILHAQTPVDLAQVVSDICKISKDSSPLEPGDWISREWMTPVPSEAAQMLSSVPFLNHMSSQALLASMSLREILCADAIEMKSKCPQIPFAALQKLVQVCSDGNPSISIRSLQCPNRPGYTELDKVDMVDRMDETPSKRGLDFVDQVFGKSSTCQPHPPPAQLSTAVVSPFGGIDRTLDAAASGHCGGAGYGQPILNDDTWETPASLWAGDDDALYEQPKLTFALPQNKRKGQTKLRYNGHVPNTPTSDWFSRRSKRHR